MKIEVSYISEVDGEKFYTREECEEHEKKSLMAAEKILFFDEKGQLLNKKSKPGTLTDDFEDWICNSDYLYIPPDGCDLARVIEELDGAELPKSSGLYVFNENLDFWESFSDLEGRYMKMLALLRKIEGGNIKND